MSISETGLVLAKMAGYARDRAQSRGGYLGGENAELLYAISHMLHVGAEHCLELATNQETVESK